MALMTKEEKKASRFLMISHFFAPLGPLMVLLLYFCAVRKPGTRLLLVSAISNFLSILVSGCYTVVVVWSLFHTKEAGYGWTILFIFLFLIFGVGFQTFLLRVNFRMKRINIHRQLFHQDKQAPAV